MKDIEVLPCGCLMRLEIRDGQKVGTFVPCRKTCDYYRCLLKAAAEHNKPITFIGAP